MSVWDDPVSGLVTGPSSLEEDSYRVEPVAPAVPEVDLEQVRRAVDAALFDEDDSGGGGQVPAPRRAAAPAPPRAPHDTPGLVAPNPRAGWPRTPSVRQLAGLRARRSPPPLPPPKWVQQRRRSGSAAGSVVAVLVVIGVILWVVFTIISGIIDTVLDVVN
jgi:hypothetical protein